MTLSMTDSRPARPPLLIVAAGHAFAGLEAREGDFVDWIAAGLGATARVLRQDATDTTLPYPEPGTLAGVIVTGSHAMVTDQEPWSERLAEWLRHCVQAGTPLLGICYGHQLLAHALGGRVGYNHKGLELGTRNICALQAAAQDELFKHLPAVFPAQLVHAQSVLELPAGAVGLAANEHDQHQAYRVGDTAWGVQFHPEFSSSAMTYYIEAMCAQPAHAHLSREQLIAGVQHCALASSLLQHFAQLAMSRTQTQ